MEGGLGIRQKKSIVSFPHSHLRSHQSDCKSDIANKWNLHSSKRTDVSLTQVVRGIGLSSAEDGHVHLPGTQFSISEMGALYLSLSQSFCDCDPKAWVVFVFRQYGPFPSQPPLTSTQWHRNLEPAAFVLRVNLLQEPNDIFWWVVEHSPCCSSLSDQWSTIFAFTSISRSM